MHRRSERRRALAALVTAAALIGAPAPAHAARNLAGVPANLTEQAASQNFLVHYTSAPGDPNAIAPDTAHGLLVGAERALGDSRSRLDLPPPMDDGDRRADVYVYAGTDRGPERGLVRADSRDDRTTGWIGLSPDATGDMLAVTHQVVHLQQLGLYRPAGLVLAEGSATWAPLHLYAGEIRSLPEQAQFFPDDPVDCDDPDVCSLPGYNAWRFFELLAERHGPQIVRAIYDRSRALGAKDHRSHLIQALQDVLTDRQTTLPATYAEYTAANLVGGYGLQTLARRRYGATEPFDDLATGTRTRRFRSRAVTLDHLSAAFYRLRSGSDAAGSGGRRCRRARMLVRVAGPKDLEAPLYWAPFRPRRGKARTIELKKGEATLELPWSTCGGREVGIALENPAAAADDRTFTLTVRLAVVRSAAKRSAAQRSAGAKRRSRTASRAPRGLR
jgi:hypothetical protein